MGSLDELLERTTIEFPIPITSEEVEQGLFEYLRQEIPCDIEYWFSIHEKKICSSNIGDERYALEFRGNIKRSFGSGVLAIPGFEMVCLYHPELPLSFYKSMKFQTVPGYDSVEEFETLPTGEEQLKLIEELRQKTQEYFSQRPK